MQILLGLIRNLFSDKTRLISTVLGGTVGHANPSAILKYLLHHPAYSGATFGEIRNLLTGMLDNTFFEEQLVTTTQRLVCSDLHSQLVYLLNGAKKGIRPLSANCSVCKRTLAKSSIMVFPCGHPAHNNCISEFQCPVCFTVALDKVRKIGLHFLWK